MNDIKPYYKTDNFILYNNDSLDVLKTIESNSINLIHIDPPYNIHIAEWDKWDSVDLYVEFMGTIFQELDRVLKDNGTMYFWHMDMKQIPHLLLYLEKETNFILNNQIIWDKTDTYFGVQATFKNPTEKNNLRSWFTSSEYCYMFTKQDVDGGSKYKNNLVYKSREYIRNEIIKAKGKIILKEINNILGVASNGGGVASSVLSLEKAKPTFITKEHYNILKQWLNKDYNNEYLRQEYEELRYTFNLEPMMNNIWKSNMRNSGENHICEKPLDLIEKIIRVSSNKGDVVLDCFNGSGTTGIVANQLDRKYIGVELMRENCEITKTRLVSLQMRLDI